MGTFYCAGCRFAYPLEKSAKITAGLHRDGEAVGFCFLCSRDISPEAEIIEPPDGLDDDAAEAVAGA